MPLQGLFLYLKPLQGFLVQFMSLQGPLVHHIPLQGLLVYHMSLHGLFFLSCTSLGVSILIYVLFRGVISFEPIGDLPCYKRILDLFVNCPSRTSIRAGVFAAGICDFVTFFVSIKTSSN